MIAVLSDYFRGEKETKFVEFVWFLLFCILLGMIIGAFQYHLFDPEIIPRRIETNRTSYPLVFIHVSMGTVWAITGFLQFTKTFQRNRKLHRNTGYIYIGSALCACLSLLFINLSLQADSPFMAGSLPLVIYSMIAIISAWICVKGGDIETHRAWMVRSMIAALLMSLDRFNHGIYYYLGAPFTPIEYIKLASLVVAELIIFRKLDFRITRKSWGYFNIAPLALGLILSFSCLAITAHLQYEYTNILGVFKKYKESRE